MHEVAVSSFWRVNPALNCEELCEPGFGRLSMAPCCPCTDHCSPSGGLSLRLSSDTMIRFVRTPLPVASFLAGFLTGQPRPKERVCLGGGRLVAGQPEAACARGSSDPWRGAESAPGGGGWGGASVKTKRVGPHTQSLGEAQDVHSQVST